MLAKGKACLERGDHDYAHDLLTQCVAEDPGSLPYAQAFRANLAKKYAGTGKKSSMFGSLVTKTGRAAVAKAAGKGEWTEAFTAGCQALRKNPIDLPVLRELAAGCGVLGHSEPQLFYLRWALDLDLHDVETNRAAAGALGGTRQFDQAIACWQRVLKQKPEDEEASRAISRLSVEQTLHQGGYDHELLRGEGASPDMPAVRVSDMASKQSDGAPRVPNSERVATPDQTVEELLAAVEADAADSASAIKLAERLADKERLTDAKKVLRRAMAASKDKDSEQHAQLEDLTLRIARLMAEKAQQDARADRSPEKMRLAKHQLADANQAELEVYAARVARTPADTRTQFELGLRLKRAGQHREAIKPFQAARGDSRRAAETQIHLGECFQHIDQFKLAASSYEAAVKASESSSGTVSEETRKLALYRAGVLALGLGDLDRAESRLTDLAGLDFGYRDVGDRLDKIAELRKNA
jgi:tetratricopeptide (TPR) repeat protein